MYTGDFSHLIPASGINTRDDSPNGRSYPIARQSLKSSQALEQTVLIVHMVGLKMPSSPETDQSCSALSAIREVDGRCCVDFAGSVNE